MEYSVKESQSVAVTSSITLSRGRRPSRFQKQLLLLETQAFLRGASGKPRDKFAGHAEEMALKKTVYDAWQTQVHSAARQLSEIQARGTFFQPHPAEVNTIMQVFKNNFSGGIITQRMNYAARTGIQAAVNLGKQSVDADYKKQTGKAPVKKADVAFGVLFGLTDQHAVQALVDQITIAAGGFWDDEMSASVRDEITEWFTGQLTREDLTKKLNDLVNTRLSVDGAKSLPGSYFDGLTEHYIVRARNIGSVYRGKELGAKEYRIVNPRDKRTSGVCKTLSAPGMIFTFGGAESKVEGILGARTQGQLKQTAPFLTDATAGQESAPVPPLHWRCRSWMQYIFEGL